MGCIQHPLIIAITFVFCQKNKKTKAFSMRVFTSFSQNKMWSRIPGMPGDTGKLRSCVVHICVLDCAGWLAANTAADLELNKIYTRNFSSAIV